jgi:hypothetical protein
LLLGIGIALTLLFSFLYQQSFFDLKTSPQEEWFLKTRKLDEIWVSGELTRIAGSFIHKTSLADKRIMVTLNSTFLEEVNTIQQIVFSPESWEFLQKLYHPLFQEGSYLAFQGKAILNQEELGAYLEGDAHSLLPLPLLKLRNPQTQEELRFSQERDRETLLVEGAILLIQENENKDLDLLLSNAGGESQVWIRIREKTLKKVEAEKFSPRLGDLVYATGILEVEEEEGSFQYTLDVDPEQMQHTFSSALH